MARAWPRSLSRRALTTPEAHSAPRTRVSALCAAVGQPPCPAPEVPLDADTLLALWQGIARAHLQAHEQSGHPPARIATASFHGVPGLWGARRSERARLHCGRARRTWRRGAPRGLFWTRCACRRSVLHAAHRPEPRLCLLLTSQRSNLKILSITRHAGQPQLHSPTTQGHQERQSFAGVSCEVFP